MRQEILGAACACCGSGRARTSFARIGRVLACGALLGLFACASLKSAPPVEYPDYIVGAPDVLGISILPEPEVVQRLTVRPDGKITIQLIGDVQAAGRTTTMIAEEVEELISRYKRGAVVTVSLESAQSSSVTVLGEVSSPTSFPLGKQMRVAEAMGNVGGVTWLANDDEVRVVRPGNPPEVIMVDLQAIRGGDLSTNVQLYGGDLIYVPPTILAQIGYAIRAVLFPFEPLIGLGTSAAGSATVR